MEGTRSKKEHERRKKKKKEGGEESDGETEGVKRRGLSFTGAREIKIPSWNQVVCFAIFWLS